MEGLEFKKALELYNEKNYIEAFTILKELEKSLLEAKTLLGQCYLNGNGVKQSFDEAFKLFSEASLAQESGAYYYLGYCYEMGYGTIQSDLQAILWYKNSAKLDNLKSMVALGRLELRYDKDEAFKWLTLASENNSVEAMLLLSDASGNDYVLKEKYLRKACESNSPRALYELAIMGLAGFFKMTEEEAKNLLIRAAELDYPDAYIFLGKELISGKRLKINLKEGFEFLLKAYNKNIKAAYVLLADAYYYGYGTRKNPLKARKILEIACRYNNSEAMLKLGDYYSGGNDKYFFDEYISLYWWEQAGILGNVEGMLRAGNCYLHKVGTNKVDLEKAYYYFNMASKKGSSVAKEELKHFKRTIAKKLKYE